jgi:cytochrome b pre-mRNA-processing protein 3
MIFKVSKHNSEIYNTFLKLSRNIFFYKEIDLEDSYETRIYLMFLHYSIVLFIQKNRGNKADQKNYDNFFFFIENNLRELGFGDVAVNKKMKDLNKIFYDILIKISQNQSKFIINRTIIIKYFAILNNNEKKLQELLIYFNNFYHFCFELTSENMIKDVQNYRV